MSHPSSTTNPNPHKRSSPFNTTSSSASIPASGGAAAPPPSQPLVPAMKKAKSQAVAYSLDNNKNGQPPHVHFSPDIDVNNASMLDVEEEDPGSLSSDVVMDPNLSSFNSNAMSRGASSGTANLSRKKATPPQPKKKLVIKLLKGYTHSINFFPFF